MEVASKPKTEIDLSKPLLRHHQREEYKGEIEAMTEMIPQLKTPQDRGDVQRRLGRLKQSLEAQTPAEITGAMKDRLQAHATELEQKITSGMLSSEEMRKNPAGAVGQHMKWERANKSDILKWKNIQQLLEPTSDDPDLSNFERLRPNGAQDRVRVNAQIPGKMSYGTIPQQNWDQAFEGQGPSNTALQQAKRVQKPLSEEQRKILCDRLAAARAIKKQQQAEAKAIVLPSPNEV
jgi:hypothetical protein